MSEQKHVDRQFLELHRTFNYKNVTAFCNKKGFLYAAKTHSIVRYTPFDGEHSVQLIVELPCSYIIRTLIFDSFQAAHLAQTYSRIVQYMAKQ